MSNTSLLSEEIHSAIIEEELLAEGILQDIIGGIASFIKKLFSQENLDKAKQLGKQGMERAKEEVVPRLKALIKYTVDEVLPKAAEATVRSLIKAMADKKIPFTEENMQIALRDQIKALIKKAQTGAAIGSVAMGGGIIGKLLFHVIAGKTIGKNDTLAGIYDKLVMDAVTSKVYPRITQKIMTFEEMETAYTEELGEPQKLNEEKTYQRWQKIAGIIKG